MRGDERRDRLRREAAGRVGCAPLEEAPTHVRPAADADAAFGQRHRVVARVRIHHEGAPRAAQQ